MQTDIRTIGLWLSELDGKSLDKLGSYGLTREVARLLAASGAAIVLLDNEGDRGIQSRSLVLDGEPLGNHFCDCLATPCQYVAGGRDLMIPVGLQKLFPKDPFLANFGLQAYAGVPMRAANGKVFGLIAAFFRESISDGELVLEVLRIVARSLSIELVARIGHREEVLVASAGITRKSRSSRPVGE